MEGVAMSKVDFEAKTRSNANRLKTNIFDIRFNTHWLLLDR